MKHELRILLAAVQFYTRLPVPAWSGYHPHYLSQATRYLPVIGWLVGFISAFTFLVTSYLFSSSLGILFSMIASILVTGGFHEDGFADACDGFGGGWTKERILEIMKDSRLGTHGVVGLILLLAAKFFSLQQLAGFSREQPQILVLMFIVGHSLSRYTAATFIFTHRYVRISGDSKVKPVALTAGKYNFFLATVLACIPLLALVLLTNKLLMAAILFPLCLIRWCLGRYFAKWIDGYTGDCLGATQQACEVFIYLTFILLWKFT